MKHNVPHVLLHMRENLKTALELVQAIESEFEANGTDSLANIDYGASLNTMMQRVNAQFKMLDESAIFTAGWEPEE